MSEEHVDHEFPPDWHRRLRRGLFVTAVSSFFCAAGLFFCALLILQITLRLHTDWELFALCFTLSAVFLLPIGWIGLLVGLWFLARPIRAGSFAVIYLGCTLLLPAGVLALAADDLDAVGLGVHAYFTILMIAFLVIGLLTASHSARLLCGLLAIDDPLLDRSARRTRTFAFVTITALLPLLLSHGGSAGSSRPNMIAVAALLVSLSFFALCVLLGRTYRAAGSSIPGLAHCPGCGYPRPPGTRCSECGLLSACDGEGVAP